MVSAITFDFASKTCKDAVMQIDESCLEITSHASSNLTIWAQLTECDKCDFKQYAIVPAHDGIKVNIGTKFPWNFHLLLENDSSVYCNKVYKFVEYGRYSWNVTEDSCSEIDPIQEPTIQYLPILAVFFLLFGLCLLYNFGKCFYHSEWLTRVWPRNIPFSELQSDLGSPSPAGEHEPAMVRAEMSPIRRSRCRVYSLDTFRGICITLMIFVNYGGGQYWFFKHSAWNGLTIADLVFPWFLWIMGASIALSLRDQLRSGTSRKSLFLRVLRRSVTLVVLGLILNTVGRHAVALQDLRLPGVLQRIGLAYFVVASMETVLMKAQGSFQYGRWLIVQDLIDSWLQWLIVASLVVAHTLVTLMLGVPGCPTGYLGPGGAHNHSASPNCTGGAAGYVDRTVFGDQHMYQRPSCKHVYNTTVPYDPEGILGTLTAVLMVYLGVQSGRILMSFNYTSQRVLRWMGWALVTGLIAGVLCNFSQNDGVIPVNKNLWSLSFVLAVASLAFVVQSTLYLIVDDKRWWTGAPLNYAGMNAILLYVGHELTRDLFPWSWQPYYKTHWEYTLMNAWATALWILIACALHRKKVFLAL